MEEFCGKCGAKMDLSVSNVCPNCGWVSGAPDPNKTRRKLTGSGFLKAHGKKILLIGIGIIAVIAFIWVFQSLLLDTQPGDAVIQSYNLLKKGEYSQAVDLSLDPYTNQPFTPERKQTAISELGSFKDLTSVQSSEIKVVSSEKINDNKYLITCLVSYSRNDPSGKHNDQNTVITAYVLKFDGHWKPIGLPYN
ncbi:hypothetical protein [Methanoregula sp. UBA64]|jgi:hypothetical protein|uniref:hypothetical protein n=1 Tax=Methanoregula sp. UBA64 TaxID=1915554 RepID=UPI0025D1928E|nr:hypothetical protein [Methanoregula sp. UBA64]